jgi:sec-independent protein translocase protein TatA
MDFLGIGLPELLVILALTLIVVGPKRLPEVAAQIARAIREFRRYSNGITRELNEAVKDLEREYGELRGEWRAVSSELREKAAAIGGDLSSIADDVQEKLQLDAPRPAGAPPEGPEPSHDRPSDANQPGGAAPSTGLEDGQVGGAPTE